MSETLIVVMMVLYRNPGPRGGHWQNTPSLGTASEDRRPSPMIPPVRQEILRQLERVSELAPDVRFGQLIANLAFLAAGPWDETLWDLEDEQLLAAIREHLSD